MTLDEIEARVAEIRRKKIDDPEHAHQLEDELRSDFIRSVAEVFGESAIADEARAVLETDKIDFPRWNA